MDDNVDGDLDTMFNDGGKEGEPADTPPVDAPKDTSSAPTPPEQSPPPAAPPTPPETPPAPKDDKQTPPPPEQAEQPPKPDGEPTPPEQPPAGDQPPAPEPPKPLTAEEVRAIVGDVRDQERSNIKGVEEMQHEVLKAYYPQGLSNVLVDEKSGREIKTPQDVIDLSGGEMSPEDAAQWLMNEQYRLDKQINEIQQSARELAETNFNFKQGATRVLEKYGPIFDKYPQLQQKIYKNYMKTVKMDSEKDLILSAPDIEDYYADVMEPYVMAFGYSQKNATPAAAPADDKPVIPESKQTAADRMDVSGDAGAGTSDEADPNDPNASLNKLFGE